MNSNYISLDRNINFEVKGDVVTLKDVIFDPEKNRHLDLQIAYRRPSLLGLHWGPKCSFNNIMTPAAIHEIQKTYELVLKTLKVNPCQLKFSSNPDQTTFVIQSGSGGSWFGRKQVKKSYPFGRQPNDILVGDAGNNGIGGRSTLHDAVQSGILNLFGIGQKAAVSTSVRGRKPGDLKAQPARREPEQASPPRDQDVQPAKKERDANDKRINAQNIQPDKKGGDVNSKRLNAQKNWPNQKKKIKKPISTLPSIPVYRIRRTPFEPGYDKASSSERRKRMIQHLDRSSAIPFSEFVNRTGQIDDDLFNRMLSAIQKLAKDPKANDPMTKYMKELLQQWYRAAYHYLDKNSNPDDSYLDLLNEVSQKIKDSKKAQAKARELYWRKYAPISWMPLMHPFATEKLLGIDRLQEDLFAGTHLSPWF